jgi:hypothetical protein
MKMVEAAIDAWPTAYRDFDALQQLAGLLVPSPLPPHFAPHKAAGFETFRDLKASDFEPPWVGDPHLMQTSVAGGTLLFLGFFPPPFFFFFSFLFPFFIFLGFFVF